MATLEEITEGMRDRIGEDCGLGATLKFDFGDDGIVFLDADTVPNVVSNEDNEADCTIKISKDNFESLAAGDLDPTTAFMMGKIKIQGNMGIAMKLQSVFS
ncbi:MAG: SCP2 sterol-binding domain-containing protein [Sneathiella sp.]|nr:SCP2 sterol-binding domain-containing protein [Sneathiella sp.]